MSQKSEVIQRLFAEDNFPDKQSDITTLLTGKEVLLYGAGESSHWFFEIVMKRYSIKPVAVLDRRFSEGDVFESIPAYHPDTYLPSEIQKQQAVVVISIGNPASFDAIHLDLSNKGFEKIIGIHDIYEIHTPIPLSKEIIEQGFNFYLKQQGDIERVYQLLSDDLSQEVYSRFLQTHMQRKPVTIPRRPREEQYFPKDVPLTKGVECFVSCGAYDGDTIRMLNATHGKVDQIVCFEADKTLFSRLTLYLEENKVDIANQITALPCAVYDHESIKPFTVATGLGSRLSEDGGLEVQTVALDSILPNLAPTLITMDIEGVELEALKGAEKMIGKHRPDLAICVYHSPSQIWQIPLYLESLNLGYRFYLRNYTSFCTETVLYASI